jgi:hypothetical protein
MVAILPFIAVTALLAQGFAFIFMRVGSPAARREAKIIFISSWILFLVSEACFLLLK